MKNYIDDKEKELLDFLIVTFETKNNLYIVLTKTEEELIINIPHEKNELDRYANSCMWVFIQTIKEYYGTEYIKKTISKLFEDVQKYEEERRYNEFGGISLNSYLYITSESLFAYLSLKEVI